MSGILDIHTQFALENGYREIVADIFAFRALFFGIEVAVVDEWHARLLERPPIFRDEAGRGPPEEKTPWVVVTLADERSADRFIGNSGGQDEDNNDVLEYMVDQDVRVSILAWNAEIVRAIHVVLRAAALLATEAFIDGGYEEWF